MREKGQTTCLTKQRTRAGGKAHIEKHWATARTAIVTVLYDATRSMTPWQVYNEARRRDLIDPDKKYNFIAGMCTTMDQEGYILSTNEVGPGESGMDSACLVLHWELRESGEMPSPKDYRERDHVWPSELKQAIGRARRGEEPWTDELREKATQRQFDIMASGYDPEEND